MSMQDEIQKDEILKRAFSKNPNDLNTLEQEAVERFLKRKLAEVHEFVAARSDRDVE